METKWKDVAHLYLGCEMQGEADTEWTLKASDLDSIDEWNDYNKPILRPLPTMTELEAKELNLADVQIGLLKFADRIRMFMTADQLHSMLKMGFDLYNLIPSGQALDRTTLPSLTNQ